MAAEVFIDTSGFYALLVRGDDRHRQATDFMRRAGKRNGDPAPGARTDGTGATILR